MPRIVLNLTEDSRRRVFTDEDMARVSALGETVRFDPKADPPEALRDLLPGADAVLTCWGSRPITAADLPAAPGRALLIAHAAGSVRSVVPKEVLARGDVRLTQGAAAVAVAVAQYTVGLLVMAMRQAYWRMAVLRDTGKGDNRAVPYSDLTDTTIGLIGLSQVGRRVPPLLAPFGCRVVAYDPYWTPEGARDIGVTLVGELDELLASADAISLHLPVTGETTNILDARRVGLLKQGCALINTARAPLLDQDAVFARAIAGEIEYYADVTAPEPLPPDNPAWQSSHIFITPHIAGPTRQTLRRMARYAVDELERHVRGEPLLYEVTHDRYDILA